MSVPIFCTRLCFDVSLSHMFPVNVIMPKYTSFNVTWKVLGVLLHCLRNGFTSQMYFFPSNSNGMQKGNGFIPLKYKLYIIFKVFAKEKKPFSYNYNIFSETTH